MRKIKFRAWDGKEMHENVVIVDGKTYKRNRFGMIYAEGSKAGTPMQFTGLYDKNGKEIYEGDIVKVIHEDGYKTIGQVEWGLSSKGVGTYPAFYIWEFESEMNSFSEIFDTGHYEIEVIGNIYEHPHLLKEVK